MSLTRAGLVTVMGREGQIYIIKHLRIFKNLNIFEQYSASKRNEARNGISGINSGNVFCL
jgi:hypothetical protein